MTDGPVVSERESNVPRVETGSPPTGPPEDGGGALVPAAENEPPAEELAKSLEEWE